MNDCVFCKIIAKTLPASLIYEDEDFISILDTHPLTPLHLLVIPRRHISSLNELEDKDEAFAGRLLLTSRKIALSALGMDGGYRLVINTGAHGGQTVFHLHLHIMAGKPVSTDLLTKGLQ